MSLSLLLAIICLLPQESLQHIDLQTVSGSSQTEPSEVWKIPDLKPGPVPASLVGLDKIFITFNSQASTPQGAHDTGCYGLP